MKKFIKKIICFLIIGSMSVGYITEVLPQLPDTGITASATSSEKLFSTYETYDGTVYISKYTGNENNVVIPEKINGKKITGISNDSFSNNSNIKTISIPDSVTYISYNAFCDCKNLKTINLGKSVDEIDSNFIYNCPSVSDINVTSQNKKFSSSSGVLYNKDKTELIYYPYGKTASSFVIPKSVKSITYSAFSNDDNSKLKYIGIFNDNINPTNLNIPYNITLYTVNKNIAKKYNDDYWFSINDYSSSLSVFSSAVSSSSITIKVTDAPKLSGIKYKYYLYNTKSKKYKLIKYTSDISCKITGLSKGNSYKIRVDRYYSNNGKWVSAKTPKVMNVSTATGSSSANSLISVGAKASITSKKLCNNSNYIYTEKYFDRWESISEISQFKDKNGNVMFAYKYKNNYLTIKKLKDNLTYTTVKNIKCKLPQVGTVIGDDKGYFYIVWAKERCKNKNDTAITITKYNSSWKEIKSVSYKSGEIDTVLPFEAGNCDAGISNGILYCLYSKQMYSGHQMADQLVVNTSNMTKSNDRLGFWCSHSFAQRVLIDHNGNPVYANQGDCYPRAFETVSRDGEKELFHFYCDQKDSNNMWIVNYTNAQLGGITDTSRDIFLAGSSVKSMTKNGYNNQARNLFIMSVGGNIKFKNAKTRTGDVFGEKITDKNIKWLTNYSAYDVMNPQVVKTDDDKFVIMWELINKNSGNFVDSYYEILTADGNVYQKATSMKKIRLNAYETPIYKKGYIYWINADYNSIKAVKLAVGKVSIINSVSGFKTTGNSTNSVSLSWSKNSNATGYQIQVKKNGKWITASTINKKTTTKYKITRLSTGTKYSVRIRAYKNINGKRYYSSFKTISVITKPANVSGFKLQSRTKNSLTFRWTKSNAVTGYKLQIKKKGKWYTYTVKSGSYKIGKLSKNTKYSVRIRTYKTISGKNYYGNYKTFTFSTLKK